MLFDTHAHYWDTRFVNETENGVDALLTQLFDGGLLGAVNVGTSPATSRLAIEQAKRFEKMYTDSAENTPYKVEEGLGILKGIMSPHYDNRPEFDDVAKDCPLAYAVENNSAIVFEDGVPVKSLSSGGSSYIFNNNIVKKL